MSAINYVNSITSSLMGIVALGGIVVGGLSALRMITAEDEYEALKHKKGIKKAIIGVILGLSVSGLVRYILNVI